MVPKLCSSSSQSPSPAGSSSRRTSARLQKLLDDEEARRRISPWEHTTALQKQQEDEDDQEEEDQKPPLRKKNKTTTIARKLKIKRNNNINNNKASASASVRPPSPPDPPQLPITADADNAITAPAATTTTAHIHAAAAAAAPHPPPPCRSDKTLVIQTIRNFNKHYLHFVQEEEKRCAEIESQRKIAKLSKSKESSALIDDTKRPSKRPDLKAITKMKDTNTTLNPEKRLGPIPGIEVGHQFFSRAEMVIVGFHSHWLNGIDYIGITASKKYKGYTLPLAVAIVVSGQYEDDLDNCDDVIYTGQGGNDLLGNKRQIGDQVMERGNLALKNSIGQGTPVRVVRGHISRTSYVGKVYTYDGLYKVHEYWAEKGVSGFTVYKFRLKRLNGQPPLTTNQVQYTNGRIPTSVSEIRGLVCEDISGGLEDIPIPATNLVDNPPVAPTDYTYRKSMQVAKSVKLPKGATGCDCKGTCTDSKRCACARLNGSDFPYVHRDGGRLIEPKAIVFECGPNCGCGPSCVNRTSQRGIKYRLEVFRTPKKGWGVRSWDFIPSGAPVCEYIGVLMRTEETDSAHENYYLFDIDCFETMKGLDGREKRLGDVSLPTHLQRNNDNSSNNDPEFCIDASGTGNITRYINHSCQPNLFVQCILSSHHDIRQARIVLFAADNIPPLQELSYDYAYGIDSVMGSDGQPRQIACYCGADDCRRRLL